MELSEGQMMQKRVVQTRLCADFQVKDMTLPAGRTTKRTPVYRGDALDDLKADPKSIGMISDVSPLPENRRMPVLDPD